jgi:acyl transferase domain-containing protein
MKNQKLVFVFSTRDYHWPLAARSLCRHASFLDTIRRCDAEILRNFGWSIEQDVIPNPDFRISEEHCEPGLTAMQIGLTELWKSYGLLPDAVVGACAGEFAAAYAAGALSLENAMELACRIANSFREGVGRGRMLLTEVRDPKDLGASGLFDVAASLGGKTMISCREENFAALKDYLKQS